MGVLYVFKGSQCLGNNPRAQCLIEENVDSEGGQRFGRGKTLGCRACGLSAGSSRLLQLSAVGARRGAERGSQCYWARESLCTFVSGSQRPLTLWQIL